MKDTEENTSLSMPLCVTDLLFNLIGFFIILLSISYFEDRRIVNENTVEELKMEQKEQKESGAKDSIAHIMINVSYDASGEPTMDIDGKNTDIASLITYLNSLDSVAKIALRCDENITVGYQNNILLACKRAGLNVNQVVKTN